MADYIDTTPRRVLRSESIATQRTASFSNSRRPSTVEVVARRPSNASQWKNSIPGSRRVSGQDALRRRSSLKVKKYRRHNKVEDFFSSYIFKTSAIYSAIAFLAITLLLNFNVPSISLLGPTPRFNISDPGKLVGEFKHLIPRDGEQIGRTLNLEAARQDLARWHVNVTKIDLPEWIKDKRHELLYELEKANKAASTSQEELEKVLSRIPVAIREKVMVDAKEMASKFGRAGIYLIGNRRLGDEYLEYIKGLEIQPDNPFGINLAVKSLEGLRAATSSLRKEIQKQEKFVRVRPWKLLSTSPNISKWLSLLHTQGQKLVDVDNEIVKVLQYLDGVRNSVARINLKIKKAAVRLERMQPVQRIPKHQAHKKIVAGSLKMVSEYLNQQLIDMKRTQVEVKEEILGERGAGIRMRKVVRRVGGLDF